MPTSDVGKVRIERWETALRPISWLLIAAPLLLVMPPTGLLSGNEEAYLQAAIRWYRPDALPRNTALLDGLPHIALFASLLGPLIQSVGYEAAQVIARIIAVVAFSIALDRLGRTLKLHSVETAVLVLVYVAVGQWLLGSEAIFLGIEPKVPAYVLLIFAATAALTRKVAVTFALLIAATYTHPLVGGMWAVILVVFLLSEKEARQRTIKFGALSMVLVAPLGLKLLSVAFGAFAESAAVGEPSIAWIYNYGPTAIHATPFATRWSTLQTLIGLAQHLVIGFAAAWVLRHPMERELNAVATIIAIGTVWLLVALALLALYPDGEVGRFVPLRPSAMVLLLFLFGAASWLAQSSLSIKGPAVGRVVLVLAGLFAATSAPRLLAASALLPEYVARERRGEVSAVIDFARTQTDQDSVFMFLDSIERDFLDFERRSQRAHFVVWKFPPATAESLREWYSRLQSRQQVEKSRCTTSLPSTPRIDFVVVPASESPAFASSCGEPLLVNARYAVFKVPQ